MSQFARYGRHYPRWMKLVAAGGLGATGLLLLLQQNQGNKSLNPLPKPEWAFNPLPSRENQLHALQTNEFDVLIIGGGATGCGCALDAVSRGLRTAMVEKYDFSSGTSSRSTKLIHGGVRYLQKAIMGLDIEQYNLVKEALHERANLLKIAPHLSGPLPIMLPVYTWWQVPYFWAGIKAYDWVSGTQCLKSSYVLSRESALEKFPMLKKDKLKAAIVYYDGQHNDARMNLNIGLTAARQGACIANHTEVLELIKEKDEKTGVEKLVGAKMRDNIEGKEFTVRAKCIINATGPFTDGIRIMDNQEVPKICQPSAGVHIILPGYYSPSDMGLLDPATSDGRVIFFLPWEGVTIAGTTDSPTEVTHFPGPREEDIQFILQEIKNYLSPEVRVRRGDVLAAWSGIRPLVIDPSSKDTQSISRNHVVEVSPSGLVTIAGGKWTTYRSMAVDALDAAIEACNLDPPQKSQTDGMILDGGYEWTPNHYISVAQSYGLESEVARHLSHTYGDRAVEVAKLAAVTGKRYPVISKRLVEDFPYIEAEVKYACKEYACKAVDVIARRTRLAFLNVDAALEALPRVLEIMQVELGWSDEKKQAEMEEALEFLRVEMGKGAREDLVHKGVTLSALDIERYKQQFFNVDLEKKGFISMLDIQKLLKALNIDMSDEAVKMMIQEADLNKNGQIDLEEFLTMMSQLQDGSVAQNRFAVLLNMKEKQSIPVARSGGGL